MRNRKATNPKGLQSTEQQFNGRAMDPTQGRGELGSGLVVLDDKSGRQQPSDLHNEFVKQ